MPPEKSQLCKNATQAITVDPIPRNIHPTHNEGRRKARAKAILAKIMRNETQVLFVDAARYWNRGADAVSVVDTHGSLVNAATVVTNFTHEAEEMAIAVALQSCTGASIIYSDSRTAIRTFSAALVSSKAAYDFSDQSSWDSALQSTELIAQLKAVQRARAVAEGLCLPAPTWVEPPD
ncbi:hypothetical protein HPB52_024053 [Rhipicephalus sanguineus]|uniref:Uncharacterized protein n=1 Tax=Rhipicephalus sanguineus TaxID=34632 RepID=A0A9D4Q8Z2_RHISA|nr:hypothetical protein HPB52_024053 [Rhipicephalus sanguineus]